MTLIALTILAAAPVRAQCPVAEEGLVGHWTLDETAGTSIADATGGGNTGTMLGGFNAGTATTAGKIASAINFDGGNYYIDIANEANFDFTGGFSVAFWMRIDAFSRQYETAISKGGVWAIERDNLGSGLRFSAAGFTNGLIGTGGDLTGDVWHHIVGVYDEANVDLIIYVDGVQAGIQTNPAGTPATDNNPVSIGRNQSSVGREWDGDLDDVRIYSRTLSPAEVATLYNTRTTNPAGAGVVAFDPRHAAFKYCNATEWVHAGIGSYNPNAVRFDGTNDFLRATGSMFTGATTQWTGSFWIRRSVLGTFQEVFDGVDPGDDITIQLNTSNQILFQADNAAGADVLNLTTNAAISDTTNWHHVMFSFDLTDAAKRHVYIDGVASTLNVGTYDTAGSFDFSPPSYVIGARNINDGSKVSGDLADFWMDFGTYIDLSAESNRRKFVSAAGMPMYLGPDGSIPTGAAPEIFMTGDTANWHLNKGVGGNFTETGALTVATTQPANDKIPAVAPDIETGLVSNWKMDETTGTLVADSVGFYSGTFAGAANVVPSTGKIDGALTFDGTDDIVSVAHNAALSNFTAFSLSAWVYPTANGQSAISRIISKSNGGTGDDYYLGVNGSNQPTFRITAGGTTFTLSSSPTTVSLNQWSHIGATWDGTDMRIFVNGIERNSQFKNGAIQQTNDTLAFGSHADGPANRRFAGRIDDVRIYNRALSAVDMEAFVNGACFTPRTRYNADHSVMEYCNGREWVAMGPVGGAAPTNGLVGHWKLDETSGSVITDSSGNGNHGVWADYLNNDVAEETVPGKLGTAIAFANGEDIDAGSGASLDNLGPMTVCTWIKPFIEADGNPPFVTKDGTVFGEDSWALAFNTFGGGFFFRTTENAYKGIYGSLPADVWQHVCGTWDGTDGIAGINVYLDGILRPPGITGDNGARFVNEPNYTVKFGYNIASNTYEGILDDIRIYNRELSAAEIAQIYLFGTSGGLGDVNNGCANAGSITGATAEGIMFYNTTHNVLQYCNGEQWIGIGK